MKDHPDRRPDPCYQANGMRFDREPVCTEEGDGKKKCGCPGGQVHAAFVQVGNKRNHATRCADRLSEPIKHTHTHTHAPFFCVQKFKRRLWRTWRQWKFSTARIDPERYIYVFFRQGWRLPSPEQQPLSPGNEMCCDWGRRRKVRLHRHRKNQTGTKLRQIRLQS